MSQNQITRRRFLALAGVTVGACALTCAGAGVLLSGEDQPETGLTIGSPELELGDRNMGKKILVAYATGAGSTGGVAEIIGKALAKHGDAVDVHPVQSVSSLAGYDAVVLGSAINGGKWLPAAVDFLQTHQAELRRIPTAFFLVCLMINKKSETFQRMVDEYLQAERTLVMPVAEGRFVGAMYTKGRPFLEGIGIRFFTSFCGLGARGGDFRQPEVIRAWAESTRPLLVQ
jgi:menaquinone-dependent protoporphyrinogen oxidase